MGKDFGDTNLKSGGRGPLKKSQSEVRSNPAFSRKWKSQRHLFLSAFSCCTKALQNGKPGSDVRILPMSDPSMLALAFDLK